jgi:hypothetical protein
MRKLLLFAACIGSLPILGLADTLTGNLIDTECLPQAKPTLASCQPSSTTAAFALVNDEGKVLKLDKEGNTKAAEALKNRADRSADPNSAAKTGAAKARITGTMENNVLKVETIEVQ